jgi:hypothetical protein
MAPLLLELSTLEVEPLQVIVGVPESGRDSCLDTLTTLPGDLDIAALLTGKGLFSAASSCNSCCCYCKNHCIS